MYQVLHAVRAVICTSRKMLYLLTESCLILIGLVRPSLEEIIRRHAFALRDSLSSTDLPTCMRRQR